MYIENYGGFWGASGGASWGLPRGFLGASRVLPGAFLEASFCDINNGLHLKPNQLKEKITG